MRNFALIICLALILLNVCDGLFTYEIIQRGGTEANPIANFFLQKYGLLEGIVGLKAFVISLVLILMWATVSRPEELNSRWVRVLYCVPLVAYSIVVTYSGILLLTI